MRGRFREKIITKIKTRNKINNVGKSGMKNRNNKRK